MAVSILQFSVVFTVGLCLGPAAEEVVSLGVSVIPLSLHLKDPQSVVVKKGASATLHCEITSKNNVQVQFTWYHRKAIISPHKDPFNRTVLDNGTLIIPHVIPGNSDNGSSYKRGVRRSPATSGANEGVDGQYRCLARNDRGALLSGPAQVTVASISRNFQKAPPVNVEIFETQPVVLPCQINSVPTASIKWELNNNPLPQSTRYVPLPSGALLIDSVSFLDSGSYRCIATNKILKKSRISSAGNLTVLPSPNSPQAPMFLLPPGFKPTVTVTAGTNLSLLCAVKGWPIPHIKWLFKAEEIGNKSILTLENISSINTGYYSCFASNIVGNISQDYLVEVQTVPYFNVTPVSTLYPSAKTLRLECKALGNPTPEVHWLVNGTRMTYKGRIRKSNSTLIFSHSFASDQGIYQCVAVNSVGERWTAAEIMPDRSKGIPQPPQNVQCRPYDETSICLTWDNPPDLSAHAFSVNSHIGTDSRTLSNFTDLGPEYITNVTYRLATGLNLSTNYTFYVRLYMQSASDQSKNVTCRTEKVRNRMLNVKALSDTCVELTWNETSTDIQCGQKEATYKVQWKDINELHSYFVLTNLRNITISGLQSGKTYRFRVRSKNLADETTSTSLYLSPSLNRSEINSECGFYYSTYNLKIVSMEPTSVNLTWTEKSIEDVDFYKICYAAALKDTVNGNGKSNCVENKETHINITSLRPGTFYKFNLHTFYKNGSSIFIPYSVEVQTATDVPSVVQKLSYRINSLNSVCITFKPPLKDKEKIVGYVVSYTPNEDWQLEKWLKINVTLNDLEQNQECPIDDNETLAIPVNNLNPEVQYMLIVQPFSAASTGNPALPLTFSTKEKYNIDSNLPEYKNQIEVPYKQKLGIALGVSVSLICILCCSSYLLLRRKCVKRDAVTRRNYSHVEATTLPNVNSRTTSEACPIEAHEMQVLMTDDSLLGDLSADSMTHVDTKGGVGFPNCKINGIKKDPKINGVVHITENPRFKYSGSNGNCIMKNVNRSSIEQNGKKYLLNRNEHNNFKTDCFPPKILPNTSKKDVLKLSDYNSNNEFAKAESKFIADSDDNGLNSTMVTFLDDSTPSSRMSPTLEPNG